MKNQLRPIRYNCDNKREETYKVKIPNRPNGVNGEGKNGEKIRMINLKNELNSQLELEYPWSSIVDRPCVLTK